MRGGTGGREGGRKGGGRGEKGGGRREKRGRKGEGEGRKGGERGREKGERGEGNGGGRREKGWREKGEGEGRKGPPCTPPHLWFGQCVYLSVTKVKVRKYYSFLGLSRSKKNTKGHYLCEPDLEIEVYLKQYF